MCRLRARRNAGERDARGPRRALRAAEEREILRENRASTGNVSLPPRAENKARRNRRDAAQRDARGCGLARGAHEFDPTANSAKLTTRAHDANERRSFDTPTESSTWDSSGPVFSLII